MTHSNRFFHIIAILFIMLTSVFLYANTLKNGFAYDDAHDIIKNDFIKDASNLPKLFQRDFPTITNSWTYRPVVTFSFFLDFSLYDLKPWGYHLTNVLLHAANSVLLYIFLVMLMKPSTVGSPQSGIWSQPHLPLLTSLLFAAHPVLTEAVNAVAFRADLLSFFFYMATLNLYILSATKQGYGWKSLYILSCLTFTLALLSKEMAATLPAIICCYEYAYSGKRGKKEILLNPRNISYVILTIGYLYLRFLYFNDLQNDFPRWDITERILTAPWLLLSYLKLTTFPVILSVDYVVNPVKSPFSMSFILPFLAITSLFIFLYLLRTEKDIFFGILFFIMTLLPALNLVPVPNPLAERYIYLATAGFVLALGASINLVVSKNKDVKPEVRMRYILISMLAVLSLYSSMVVRRNEVWENEFSLWSDTVNKVPNSSRAHVNLGAAYLGLGKFYADNSLKEIGFEHYRESVRLSPDNHHSHNLLAIACYNHQRYDEAIKEFQAALKIWPGDYAIHTNLGAAYMKKGLITEAEQEGRLALKLKPGYTEALKLLETLNATINR